MNSNPPKGGLTLPYSFSYSAEAHFPGSFPLFRTGTKAAFSIKATIGPTRNPLASRPTTTSIFPPGRPGIVCKVRWDKKLLIRTSKAAGSLKIGKISQKLTP